VIAAVIVHDRQQRNLVMGRGPQNTRGVVQIAVGLNVDGQAAVLAICKSCADRRRSVVADTAGTLAADVVIVLVHVPQTARPPTDETLPSNE
jgi:hypothetical protein